MKNSLIGWTTHTFNPWWGCVKVSPACTNCYAADQAHRFGTEWGKDARRKFFGDKHWAQPLHWNKQARETHTRARVFCASMADVFEQLPESHPDRIEMHMQRLRLWHLIVDTPHLDWLLLTKRPENVMTLIPQDRRHLWYQHGEWPDNVWMGVTVEDMKRAKERIPILASIPSRVKFLSMEPLTEIVNLLYVPEAETVDWIITGGESGPNARPAHPNWYRLLRAYCEYQAIPFFFKQWGEWIPEDHIDRQLVFEMNPAPARCEVSFYNKSNGDVNTQVMIRVGKHAAGNLLDGKSWEDIPMARKQECRA